ncbi:XBP1 [Branchiostoma lanceolatum]|uniref:X-box-binding protein 1 n=1 Tax=Branchiostoma lanceolatum TaxID=7740 RepID=A0A8J9YQE9_BRALA|nr:XBP1 [Branchiostoma lanceolatum]
MSTGIVFAPAGAAKRIAPINIAGRIAAPSLTTTNMASAGVTEQQPRKRRRLNHLSPEEKAMRRKLKNRVAAQTARDRKKAKMDELEVIVAKLEAQNKTLKQQNSSLKQQSNSLKVENAELKKRLGQSEVKCKQETRETSLAAEGPGADLDHLQPGGMDPDAECDVLLSLLEQLDPDNFFTQLREQTEGITASDPAFDPTVAAVTPGQAAMGATAPRVDSAAELIRLDHVYHKEAALDHHHQEPAMKTEPMSQIKDTLSTPTFTLSSPPLSPFSQDAIGSLSPLAADIDDDMKLHSPMSFKSSTSDSGIEDAPSPYQPLLGSGTWEETFTTELFPQLISV